MYDVVEELCALQALLEYLASFASDLFDVAHAMLAERLRYLPGPAPGAIAAYLTSGM